MEQEQVIIGVFVAWILALWGFLAYYFFTRRLRVVGWEPANGEARIIRAKSGAESVVFRKGFKTPREVRMDGAFMGDSPMGKVAVVNLATGQFWRPTSDSQPGWEGLHPAKTWAFLRSDRVRKVNESTGLDMNKIAIILLGGLGMILCGVIALLFMVSRVAGGV